MATLRASGSQGPSARYGWAEPMRLRVREPAPDTRCPVRPVAPGRACRGLARLERCHRNRERVSPEAVQGRAVSREPAQREAALRAMAGREAGQPEQACPARRRERALPPREATSSHAATTSEILPAHRSTAAEAVRVMAVADRHCRARWEAADLLPERQAMLVSIRACQDREALLPALARRSAVAAAAQERAEQRRRVRPEAAQERAEQ